MKFAKLFEDETLGQILVKIDQDEGEDGFGPEIRFYVSPPNLGVCSIALKFDDDDEGWGNAEEVFEGITIEQAIGATKEIFEMSDEMGALENDNL